MKAEINTNKKEFEHLNNLTEKIIGAAFEVANELGPGFLEKIYERALFKFQSATNVNQSVPT